MSLELMHKRNMESGYWHSHQQDNWSVVPVKQNSQAVATLSASMDEEFVDTITTEIPQPIEFSNKIPSWSDLKYIMRKTAMVVVGVTLFVAGYRHIHRQTEYVTAKAAQTNPGYSTTPITISEDIKQTAAFRLVKPS
ncbi:hypothetical protein [Spirosoma oryzicola]|uniref:hypothetical protein n=1 Tax=Spirosoma oryzicola TaxID=2898794 RepID=UPI001E3CBA8B|nr:hypothetical protein [Spirosoma oryzicola]UHG91285.1 hypothetical protein LQ777_24025 [Spirosoma oryzicola]